MSVLSVPASLAPAASLRFVASVLGLPARRLVLGVDSPGCVWLVRGGAASLVAATPAGLAAARARWA